MENATALSTAGDGRKRDIGGSCRRRAAWGVEDTDAVRGGRREGFAAPTCVFWSAPLMNSPHTHRVSLSLGEPLR